jgi:hypothetical protein
MNDQLDVLRIVSERLTAANISFMLSGSLAMAYYATPRMTRDIDIVIELDPSAADHVVDLLEPDFLVDRDTVRSAARNRRMFNAIHAERIFKVDFIVRKDSDYRRTEFARRRPVTLEGVTTWLVSAEDLILSKLAWAKEGDSSLQRKDARTIVASVNDLDWQYLRRWATVLGVEDELDEATR